MSSDPLPTGYVPLQRAGRGSFALAGAAEWAEAVLEEGHGLHGWASEQEGAQAFDGRGIVYAVPAPAPGPDGRGQWAFRHYRRGGAVASVAEDLYLSTGLPRPLRELHVAVEARARGVPTPAVIAGATYPKGAVHRADLVTELVPDAVSLREGLFGDGGLVAEPALAAAGRLVRVLEDAGIVHRDLSAGNILLERESGATHVIDLDRAVAVPATTAVGDRMRARLERSLAKLERTSGLALSGTAWDALRAGYGGGL